MMSTATTSGNEEAISPPPPTTSSVISLKVNTVMKSLRNSVGQWSFMDATVGLKYFISSNHNKEKDQVDTAKFIEESGRLDLKKEPDNLLERILRWAEIMTQIDNKPRDKFLAATHIPEEDLLLYDIIATHERTGYCVWLDRKEKIMVLSLRGTHNTADLLMDLQAVSIPFVVRNLDGTPIFEGQAHKGMFLAAKWFEQNMVLTLEELLQRNPGFSLVVTGHSLGAAVAALLTMLLRPRFPDVCCVAIAPPPCVDAALADQFRSFVTALILADDIVPRISTANMERLRAEVEQYNWQEELHRDLQANKWTANISYYLERRGWIRPRSSTLVSSLSSELEETNESATTDNTTSAPTLTDLTSPSSSSASPISTTTTQLTTTTTTTDPTLTTRASIIQYLSLYFSRSSSNSTDTNANTSNSDSSTTIVNYGYFFRKKPSPSPSSEFLEIEMQDNPHHTENEDHDQKPTTNEVTSPTSQTTSPPQPPLSPQQVEEVSESSAVHLYPPGRLLHMRRLDSNQRVYIKEAPRSEFESIPLVSTCVSDHRMVNYYNTLLDYSEQDAELECVSARAQHHRVYIHEKEDDLEQEWQIVRTTSDTRNLENPTTSLEGKRTLVIMDPERIRADVKHYLQEEEGDEGIFNPFAPPKKQKISVTHAGAGRIRSNSNKSTHSSSLWED